MHAEADAQELAHKSWHTSWHTSVGIQTYSSKDKQARMCKCRDTRAACTQVGTDAQTRARNATQRNATHDLSTEI